MLTIKKVIIRFLLHEKIIKDYAAPKLEVKSVTGVCQAVKEYKYILFFWFVVFVSF